MFSLRVVLVVVQLVMISAALSTPSLATGGRGEETHVHNQDKIYLVHGQKRSIEAQQPVKEQQNKPQVKPKQQPKNPASAMIPAKLPENTIQIDQGSYITVFDTINNIPFYSAYVITPEEAAQIGANKGMAIWKEDIEQVAHASKVYANNKKDAKGNILAIGHMNPPYINSFDQKSMDATFRLSNAAPQYQTSHGGPWKRYEELLAAYATEVCAKLLKGALYVYTGTEINKYVKEPDERTQGTLKKAQEDYPEITIPSIIYTAACCVNADGVQASMAVMTNNHYYLSDLHQTEMTVPDLYQTIGLYSLELFTKDPLKQCNTKEKAIILSKVDVLQKLVEQQQLAARIRDPASVLIPARLPPDTRQIDHGPYITIFDTRNNIPLYSAYVIYPEEALKIGTFTRQGSWDEDIRELKHANAVYDQNRGGGGQILERGHMNPSYINTFLQAQTDLTFKLSNAAPQYKTSNGGPWNRYEGLLAEYAKKVCATKYGGTLYVYTGTALGYVPGYDEPAVRISRTITKPAFIPPPPTEEQIQRVNKWKQMGIKAALPERIDYPEILIPASIFTAACCVSAEGVQASMAVMTNNHYNEADLHQTQMTVPDLYEALGGFNGVVELFTKHPLKKCNTKFKAIRI